MKKKKPTLPDTGCHNCRFWKEETEAADETRNGSCRRHCPTVLYDVEEGAFSLWPFTTDADYCGEYQPTQH
jgi:hypothetical protein